MKLYLMRHGHAVEKFTDAQRPLSERGRAEAAESAESAVKRHDISIKTIYHSPKLRARQTAEILAEFIKSGPDLIEAEQLLPDDDISYWYQRAYEEDDIALVGHMPYMADLASRLLINSGDNSIISFQTAQIVHIAADKDGICRLEWIVRS